MFSLLISQSQKRFLDFILQGFTTHFTLTASTCFDMGALFNILFPRICIPLPVCVAAVVANAAVVAVIVVMPIAAVVAVIVAMAIAVAVAVAADLTVAQSGYIIRIRSKVLTGPNSEPCSKGEVFLSFQG